MENGSRKPLKTVKYTFKIDSIFVGLYELIPPQVINKQ